MTDFTSLQSKVNDLKAKVEQYSITPSYLGALLDDFIALIKSINKSDLSDEIARRDQEINARILRAVYNYDYNAEPAAEHVHDSMAEKDTGAVVWLTEYKRFALCAPGGTEYYLQWPSMISYMVERTDGWHVRKNFYGNMSTRHVVYIDSDGEMTDVHKLLQDAVTELTDMVNGEQTARTAADAELRESIDMLVSDLGDEQTARERTDSLAVYHYDYDDNLGDGMLGATAPGPQGAVVWLRDVKRFAFLYTGASDTPTVRYYGEWLGMEAYMTERADGWHVRPNFYGNMASGSRRVVFIDGDGNVTDIHKSLQDSIDNEAETRKSAESALTRLIDDEETARKDADEALQKAVDSKLHVVEFDGIVRYATLEDTMGSIADPTTDAFIVSWVEAAGRFCLQEDDGSLYNNAMPFDMLAPYHTSQTAPARTAIFRDRTTGISYLVAGDGPRQSLIPLSPVTGYHALPFHGTAPANITIEPAGLGDSTGGKVMLNGSGSFVLCIGDLVKKYYSVWGGSEDGTVAPSSEYMYNGTLQIIAGKYFFSTSDSRLYKLDQRSFSIEVIGGDDGIIDEAMKLPLFVNSKVYLYREDGTWVDALENHVAFDDMYRTAVRTYGDIDYTHTEDGVSKPYKLNGLWLTYEDAVVVMNLGTPKDTYILDSFGYRTKARTNLPMPERWLSYKSNFIFYSAQLLEVANYTGSAGIYGFGHCFVLHTIIGTVFDAADTVAFSDCYALKDVHYRVSSGKAVSFKDSPLLSYESLRWTVDDTKTALAKVATLTVHPDVYAKLTGDTTNAACAALTDEERALWVALMEDGMNKNITFLRP